MGTRTLPRGSTLSGSARAPSKLDARIAIVGSGVVGFAAGLGLLRSGADVLFVDVNSELLRRLGHLGYGTRHIDQVELTDVEIVLICVSTPTIDGRISLANLEDAADSVGKALKTAIRKRPDLYRVVSIRSTVPPGTTASMVIPVIEAASGARAGDDFGVAVNPEYLREARANQDSASPRATVIGAINDESFARIQNLYRGVGCPIYRLSIEQAEFQKYIHNLFNATKIAFFNEMRAVAAKLELEVPDVFSSVLATAEGIWNPAYGTRDFGPFAGSCLPKDTSAFLAFACADGIDMPILTAVIEANARYASRRT